MNYVNPFLGFIRGSMNRKGILLSTISLQSYSEATLNSSQISLKEAQYIFVAEQSHFETCSILEDSLSIVRILTIIKKITLVVFRFNNYHAIKKK